MKKSLKIILIVLAALILICAAAIGIFYIRINNPANVFDHLSGTPAPTASSTISAATMQMARFRMSVVRSSFFGSS